MRPWMRFLIWLLGLTAVLTAGLWTFQRRLIYFPDSTIAAVDGVLQGWTDETIVTADGVLLGAWYRAPDAGAPVAIVFNGNAGNRAARAPLGDRFADHGYGVLLFDYRGYGDSQGDPSEEGLHLDARAAADFIAERTPDHPVVYFGESLGAAVASRLAAERTPTVLVLRSPFTSLVDMAAVHYPMMPARLVLEDRFPTIEHISAVDAPLLVIAGSGDSIVPPDQSRQVFEAAPGPKEYVVVDGADHNDWPLAGPAPVDVVVRFTAEQK